MRSKEQEAASSSTMPLMASNYVVYSPVSIHPPAMELLSQSFRHLRERPDMNNQRHPKTCSNRQAVVAAFAVGIVGTLGVSQASGETPTTCAAQEIALESRCVPLAAAADGLREIVRGAIEKYGLKGVIVSVQVADTSVLTESWGESMTGVPVTVDAHFRNGAIAIPYLTTLLLQLSDERVLSHDDSLSKWFPEYPEADLVTLKMLANCTAGYADYEKSLPILDNVFRHWRPAELIEEGLSHPMACEPGTCFNYAHTNFVILGEVLRKATGKPVEDLIRERILEPLALKDTRSESTAIMQQPVLHAFTTERGIYEDSTYWDPSWTLARGAVMTTNIHDALASAIAFGTGRLLSPEAHRLMLAPLTAKFPPMSSGLYYGLGIILSNSWVMQTPSFGGYSAVIAYLPSRRIAFAVTSTMGPATPDERVTNRLAAEIGGYLAPDHPPGIP